MTVSNQQTEFPYTGNGVTVTFAYSCQVQKAGDLQVYVNGSAVTSGITKNGIGSLSGGSVTFSVAPASGAAVRLERVVVLERTTDYQQNGDFLARVVNPDFDRIWMALQQFFSNFKRVLSFPKSDIDPITELPPAASRANNLLGFDSLGNPIAYIPSSQSAAAVLLALAGAAGASMIGWIHNLPGSIIRTVQSRLRDTYHITDAPGVVADSTTDNTAAIIAAFTALGASFKGMIYIPYGVKFNFTAVNAAMPVGAILFDQSAINAWYTSGYKQRTFGYTDAGDNTAAIDMQFRISSGHNATMILDNRGTASSNSGQLGIAGLLWGRGQLTKQAGNEGTRHLARVEWSKIPGGSKWWWILRNHVSWAARDFEYWYTGKTWAAGSYCQNDPGGIYVTAAGGVSGATPPTHSSGTVSDGGVSWTYYQSLDNGIWAVNENGEMATNITPADGVVAYFKGSPNSVGSASLFVEAANGKGAQNADFRLRPANASGFATAMPYHMASYDVGVRLISSTGTRTGYLMDDANGLQLSCWAEREFLATNNSTSPSVADTGLLRLANTAATSITTFINSSPRQIVKLWAENANTTLVHNASFFVLRGGVNVLLQPNYVVVMQRYSQSAAWFEVSRNF